MKVAKKTIERTAEHSDEPIKLEFHGGEPLIHYRFIKQVVEYADQFRRKDGSKKFYFTMQTNASLLDEEKVDFLAKHNFRVGTSLDGLSEFNDKTRVYGNGKSTFEDTLRGIRLLQERKVPFGTIRVISNVSAVDRVRDFMLETGIRSLKLNPYFNQGRGTLVMPVQRLQRQYAYKTLELVDRLIEHNEGTDEKLRLGNVSIMLKNLMTSERAYMCMRSPCGAGTSMLGVDIDGSVYPCEEMTGKKDLIIGNVLYNTIGEMVHIPLVQLLKSRRPEDREDCGSCEVRNACEVSCANRSHNMTKGFYAKSEMCGYYKIMFPELMWRVSDNPEGMLKLI
jgi:radical SAM protein with 4Fe4S-binding SPASM domain